MISERTFASSFSGFWSELLPLLTPSLVHRINIAFRHRLTDARSQHIGPMPVGSECRDPAAVAEFAFYLAEEAARSATSPRTVFGIPELRKTIAQRALHAVARADAREPVVLELCDHELEEGLKLAARYQVFLASRPESEPVEFGPAIPGAGFLPALQADVSIGNTLFEVKTVTRNLAGKDLRQLVVYLALQWATGNRRWHKGGFFNPRRAEYHEFAVSDLIERMAGGRSSSEVFQNLIDFVSSRDVQLDDAF